jgi:hypothetical protein
MIIDVSEIYAAEKQLSICHFLAIAAKPVTKVCPLKYRLFSQKWKQHFITT